VDFAYSEPSDLLTRDEQGNFHKTVKSSQGVRQGDPLSSLLFAIAIHPLYQSISNNAPNIRGIAIHDDFTLVGPIDELLKATENLIDEAKSYSLNVQCTKCKFIYFHSETTALTAQQQRMIEILQLPVILDCAFLLGCPIGGDILQVQNLLTKELENRLNHEANLYLSDSTISTQAAILMLRISYNRKLDYLMRCLDPRILEDKFEPDGTRSSYGIASKFDNSVLKILCARLELNAADEEDLAIIQARLPIRDGGFGLTATNNRTSFCYLASLATACRTKTNLMSFEKFADGNNIDSDCLLLDGLDFALQKSHTLCNNLTLPSSVSGFCEQFVTKSTAPRTEPLTGLQKNLLDTFNACKTKLFVKEQTAFQGQRTLPRNCTAEEKERHANETLRVQSETARLQATTAPASSLWITAFPSTPDTTMTNFEFRVASYVRLNLQPANCIYEDIVASNICDSCFGADPFKFNTWHHIGCNGHRRELTSRHHGVYNVIARHVDLMNTEVVKEPASDLQDAHLRPDLKISLHHADHFLDVTIVHPLCKKNLGFAQHQLGSAAHAEKEKNKKYLVECDKIKAKFHPFAIETFGGLGKQAGKFLTTLALFATENCCIIPAGELMTSLRNSIACAVQKGNALIVARASVRASHTFEARVNQINTVTRYDSDPSYLSRTRKKSVQRSVSQV
jgi:hypothetical protein